MTTVRVRLAVLLMGSAIAVSACGSSDDASDSSDPPTSTVAGDPTDTTVPATSPAEPSQPEPSVATTEPAVAAPVDGVDGFLDFRLAALATLAGDPGPADAGRPTLRWEAVDGAAEYTVVVTDADAVHWAATTSNTEMTVGGAGLDPQAVGSRVDGDMTWYVYATDSTGLPIAQSAGQPIPT